MAEIVNSVSLSTRDRINLSRGTYLIVSNSPYMGIEKDDKTQVVRVLNNTSWAEKVYLFEVDNCHIVIDKNLNYEIMQLSNDFEKWRLEILS